MKKKYIAIIIVIILILIGILSVFLYQRYIEEGRKYEIEEIKDPNYFIIKQKEGYGVITKEGTIVVEPSYEKIIIPNPQKAIFVCYQDNESKILNDMGEEILTEFDNVQPIRLKNIASSYMYEKNVLTYNEDEKIGLVNLEGKEIAKPIYDEISALPYKEGELLVKKEEKYGVINIKGNNLVKLVYDQISVDNYYEEENKYLNSGYIVGIKTDEGYRYGYVNIEGNEILAPEFNALSRITDIKDDKNIYLMGSKNGQYGLYNKEEQIIPNEYLSMRYDATNDILVVEKGKKYGVVNLKGENIIPIEYSQIDITGKNIYARKDENETIVFDKKGNKVNIDSNVSILEKDDEKYSIKIDSTQGTLYSLIDKNRNVLTKGQYSYLSYLYDDYFIASTKEGKLGVIDASENQKIEIKYDSIEKVDDTKLLKTTVTLDKTTQIYSSNFEQICEMKDATIENFDNYIKIYNQEETRYFDLEGKEKKNTELLPNNTIFADKKNGKWGYIDKSGNIKVDYLYDKVTDINNYGFGGIKKDGKWGVIDKDGNIILDPTYEINNTSKEPYFLKDYYKIEFGFGEYYFIK